MKYAWTKTLLKAQWITTSDISRGVSIYGASGSSSRRVRPRTDVVSSGDSAYT